MTVSETSGREASDPPGGSAFLQWAMALFDGAPAAHQLPDGARRLLRIAGDCYQAAGQGDAEAVARRGRDIALAAPIDGLTSDEQAIVAGAVALQRGKARPRREPALLRLKASEHKMALRLAAILQVARGLDSAGHALLIQAGDGATTLAIGGEHVGDLADVRTELWRDHIGTLTIRPAEIDEGGVVIAAARNGWEPALALTIPPDGLDGGEPIVEGARRVLRRFFGRMLAREDAVVKDDDPEDVHQMRVASRRMRAALQIVETVYDRKEIRRYRRGLRRVAQALADVRDLDVFHEHVAAYQRTQPEESRAGIEPLLAAIAALRTQARATLLADLKQRRYDKFKRRFARFLTTPGADLAHREDVDATTRVRDFAGSAIWRRYEQWGAHEVALDHPSDADLHAARIAGKRLRYTLEFFAEALGPNVEQALAPLVDLQECLGALQDAVVARQRVHELGVGDQEAVQAYLQARDEERAARLAELTGLWEKVGSMTYRRELFELIIGL